MATKDEFIAALGHLADAARSAHRNIPTEFGPNTREGRALNAMLTRLPEQIDDMKTLLIDGYRAPNQIISFD